jgi:hypothetical protein
MTEPQSSNWESVARPPRASAQSGVRPAVRAALWATVVATFRICAFVFGAWTLATFVILGIALLVFVSGAIPAGAALPAWMHSGVAGGVEVVLAPIGSLTIGIGRLVVAAYVGAQVPVRTAEASAYPLDRIRRWVAGVGVLSLLVLLLIPLEYDVILGVCTLLVPIAFGVAALRGPAQPRKAVGMRPYLALAGSFLLFPLISIGAVILLAPTSMDSAAIGEPMSAIGIDPAVIDVEVVAGRSPDGPVGRSFVVWDAGAPIPEKIATIHTEVWPATTRGSTVSFGPAPVLTTPSHPVVGLRSEYWTPPTPALPQLVGLVAIGITPDGRRIVLGDGPQVQVTPSWFGSAIGFFLRGW